MLIKARQIRTIFPLILSLLIGLFSILILPAPVIAYSTKFLLPSHSPPTNITFTSIATVYLPLVVKPPNTLIISKLVYDGSDEYVEITNKGPGIQNFTNWTIVSVEGSQTYNFPAGFTLAAGGIVRVHSGPAAFNNPPTNLIWTTAFIWNNNGDKAELYDHQNNLQSSACYSGGC